MFLRNCKKTVPFFLIIKMSNKKIEKLLKLIFYMNIVEKNILKYIILFEKIFYIDFAIF